MKRTSMPLFLSVLCTLVLITSVTGGSARAMPAGLSVTQPGGEIEQVTPSISFLDTAGNANQSSIAVDSSGGVHVAASPVGAVDGGTYPAYYAYCPSNCSNSTNWSVVQLENLGVWGGYVRLILDSNDHPRMTWIVSPGLEDGEYHYAACDHQCTLKASWTFGNTGPSYTGDDGRYFNLDNQNRPRMVLYNYHNDYQGTYYRFCDSGCASIDNWWETRLTIDQLFRPSLVFTSSGQPRFLAQYLGGSERELRYYACEAGCDDPSNWSFTTLFANQVDMSYTLRLDHNNRPRIALYTGYNNDSPDDRLLEYLWCDSTCLDTSNWYGYKLGLDAYYGVDPDLAFDKQNRPNIAFYADWSPYGIYYSNCTANCEAGSATWNHQFIETADDLNASEPVPVKPGCSISSWYPGQKPSLALSSTGQPYFAYDAEHLQGGTCYAETDITLVRAAVTGEGGGGNYKSYLPLLRR